MVSLPGSQWEWESGEGSRMRVHVYVLRALAYEGHADFFRDNMNVIELKDVYPRTTARSTAKKNKEENDWR